jgi:hypothetical protein
LAKIFISSKVCLMLQLFSDQKCLLLSPIRSRCTLHEF